MDWGSFSYRLWMNRSELIPLWKAANRSLSSTSSTLRASLLKRVTNDRKLSFSPCSMANKLDEERLCLCPPMKLLTNNLLNSSKELTEFRGILLNQTHARPLRVVGKALHMISSGTPWRCIVVLKVAMWSNGSRVPSYESKEGSLNFNGRGWPLMEAVKGDSVNQIFYRIRPPHILFHFLHDFLHLVHFFFQVWYHSWSGASELTSNFSILSITMTLCLSSFFMCLAPHINLHS